MKTPLPIDAILPEILASLETNPCLVLQASPGAGKTTRVPPALLRAAFARGGEIVVLEPRRIAAKLSARRVAEELGEPVGKTVGYQFRFEKVGGRETRLRFLTEGMLMRRLLGDPELEGVAAVVLDEFHERHLHADLALAYLRRLQLGRRPGLRIVVMSATLEAKTVSAFLGNCPSLEVEGRLHPVELEYLASPPSKPLETLVREAVERTGNSGDALVFLPGMAEIRRAERALEGLRGVLAFPLHGELSREEQDAALSPAPDGRRKAILSTNVAETSLTIEGVTTVIDSGLHRSASYSWWSGVPRLKTQAISRASAIQRAGRAGRTGPGRCLRLYTRGDFDGRAPFERPELQRADLTQTVLELKALGVVDLAAFPWFEAPAPGALDAASLLLWRLGALSSTKPDATLTPLGLELSRVPAHPRIARVLLEARARGALDEAAIACTELLEGEPDERVRRQLFESVSRAERAPRAKSALELSLLAGFPDRVAQKRGEDLVFSAGGSAPAPQTPEVASADLGSEFFLVTDIQESQRPGQARPRLHVRSLVGIQAEWLFDLVPPQLEEREDLEWDGKRVTAVSRLAYGEISLSEDRGRPKDRAKATKLLLKSALGVDPDELARLPVGELCAKLAPCAPPEELEAFFCRLALLARDRGEPAPDSAAIARSVLEALEPAFEAFTLEELRGSGLPARLAGALEPALAARLERELPGEIPLGKRRGVKVAYKFGQPPWLESRMQDFFGLERGPALLGGRLPLTLHLLAPNQRAVQVTSDLAGFWKRVYPELRRELCRHYPRHFWPENPLEAEPDRLIPRGSR